MTDQTPISAFDLDHTLIEANSSLLFYQYLVREGVFHPLSLLRTLFYSIEHRFFNLGLLELHEKVFKRFLKGKPIQLVEEQVAKFLKEDFYRFIYYPSFSRLRRAQHEGHHTIILSNSPSFIVGPVARYLGVSHWCSSEYAINEKGDLDSVKSILLGEGKASYLKTLASKFKTDIKRVTAYSDSPLDLPFLSAAGTAVVVNPTQRMRKISQENYWEII